MLALDSVGVDVVPRALRLNRAGHEPPARLLELEAKSARGCDVVVQHLLPHDYTYNGRLALNVAMYATETSDFRASCWADRINAMDRAIVFNQQSATASRRSGVRVPIHVVPHATDVARFQRSYEPLDLLKGTRERGEFNFYFIGEFTRRKNLLALLKAFHSEFDPSEPVNLVIKTGGATLEQVRGFSHEVKKGLKLHGGNTDRYKEEIVAADRLTDEEMLRLHAGCDCFVMPSYGEAHCIPAFDAMAMGRTPIVTACTGFLEYVSDETGWLVDCREEPVFGVTDTFQDLFVGTESWASADVLHLRRCMREAYARPGLRQEKAARGIARAYDFSHEVVGSLLKRALQNDPAPLEAVA